MHCIYIMNNKDHSDAIRQIPRTPPSHSPFPQSPTCNLLISAAHFRRRPLIPSSSATHRSPVDRLAAGTLHSP